MLKKSVDVSGSTLFTNIAATDSSTVETYLLLSANLVQAYLTLVAMMH